MNKFWNFAKDEKKKCRCLFIEGTIAEDSWFEDDYTPKMFRKELNAEIGDIDIYINSPGGDCFAASQIYNMITEYRKEGNQVTVKIEGIAASAASVIAMAGSEVLMATTGMLMIHNPSTCAFGDKKEMEKAIEILEEVKECIINAYEAKTGLQRAHISRLMDAETWMNAKKAIELGFADGEISADEPRFANSIEPIAFESKTLEDAIFKKAVAKAMAKEPTLSLEEAYNQLESRKRD